MADALKSFIRLAHELIKGIKEQPLVLTEAVSTASDAVLIPYN
jgi:hypothetical protein